MQVQKGQTNYNIDLNNYNSKKCRPEIKLFQSQKKLSWSPVLVVSAVALEQLSVPTSPCTEGSTCQARACSSPAGPKTQTEGYYSPPHQESCLLQAGRKLPAWDCEEAVTGSPVLPACAWCASRPRTSPALCLEQAAHSSDRTHLQGAALGRGGGSTMKEPHPRVLVLYTQPSLAELLPLTEIKPTSPDQVPIPPHPTQI